MPPHRVVLLVMDSVGVGELPDAARYGDQGSNTVGNVARRVPLAIPTLRTLGLGLLAALDGPAAHAEYVPRGGFGRMAEASPGKDSVTGHWELAGIVLDRPFPTFPEGFPLAVIEQFERAIGRPTLGNVVGSGTAIIERFGADHLRTGAPIVYTSADSVFQIAAHEEVVPVDELYRFCRLAFDLVSRGLGVARVIARPFVGTPGAWVRTANRRDLSLEPPAPTLLDRLAECELPVVGIGKIEDLFSGRGITRAVHTASDEEGMDVLDATLDEVARGLIFVNLVDFDTLYGHRNDVEGYAANLERFDARLARLIDRLRPADLLIVTADHGNDPTTPSTDHSREYVPLFVVGDAVRRGVRLGTRHSFADVGQTLAQLFGARPLGHGTSFLHEILR